MTDTDLLPLVFDGWYVGSNMTLILHSLLSDTLHESYEYKPSSLYKTSKSVKSQIQQNIDFVQSFSDSNFATISLNSDMTGDIKYGSLVKRCETKNKSTQKQRVPFVDLKVKIILLGSSGVGKTKMCQSFENNFKDEADSRTDRRQPQYNGSRIPRTTRQRLPLRTSYDAAVMRETGLVYMSVCDTAGQERYRSLTSSYYRGTHGCLILFDVTKRHTFDNVQSWYNDLNTYCTAPELISTILVGTNCDAEDADVQKDKAQMFAQHTGIPYMEVCTDDPCTVKDVFERLADMIIENYKLHPPPDTLSTSTKISKLSKKHTWCSC